MIVEVGGEDGCQSVLFAHGETEGRASCLSAVAATRKETENDDQWHDGVLYLEHVALQLDEVVVVV